MQTSLVAHLHSRVLEVCALLVEVRHHQRGKIVSAPPLIMRLCGQRFHNLTKRNEYEKAEECQYFHSEARRDQYNMCAMCRYGYNVCVMYRDGYNMCVMCRTGYDVCNARDTDMIIKLLCVCMCV